MTNLCTDPRFTEIEYEYWLPEHGQTREHAYTVKVKAWDAEDVATEAAEDYHGNHDGWESSWPVRIAVWYENAEHVFDVDLEAVPSFHASRVS